MHTENHGYLVFCLRDEISMQKSSTKLIVFTRESNNSIQGQAFEVLISFLNAFGSMIGQNPDLKTNLCCKIVKKSNIEIQEHRLNKCTPINQPIH